MLKELILIFITTFGFIKSDVRLLELPKESKNFGASIKDFYKNDYKGSYTYIFENENGHKQRQDGVYGEKRGYYTFKAPLPDGRTFTVCYYTRNGYHAKTTIIEVADVEAFCDMIIEQSGNFKIQKPQTSNTLSTKKQLHKTESDSKTKSKTDDTKRLFTTNKQKASKSFGLSTPFRIQKTYSKNENFSQINNKSTQSSSLKAVPTAVPEKLIEANPTISLNQLISSDLNNQELNELKKTKIPFIINGELIESQFDSAENAIESSATATEFGITSSTEPSFDIPLTLSLVNNIPEIDSNIKLDQSIESDSVNAPLSSLDTDLAPPSNAPRFEIPTPISFKQTSSSSAESIMSCDDLNKENENPDIDIRFSDCGINELPTSKPKIDALIAEVFKYSLKRPSEESIANATEIIPPSRLFLPPYIDDDLDLLRPSLDLIPPVPNNIILTTYSPIDSTLITSTEKPTFKRTPPATENSNKVTKSTTAKPIITTKGTTVTPITTVRTLKTTKRTMFSTSQRTANSRPTVSKFIFTTERTTIPRFTTTTLGTTIKRFTTTTLRTTKPRFTTKRTIPSRVTVFKTTNPRFTTAKQETTNPRLTTTTQRNTHSRFTTISRITTPRFTTTNPRTTNSKLTTFTKIPTTSIKFLTTPTSSLATNLNNNIQKPSLDILPPFKAPSFEILPPIRESESILFDVRILNDNSKNNSSNIVSRSISSTYKTNEECKHGILRTNPIGISEYISPATFEELEVIQNVIKVYGCHSISKFHRGQKSQSYKYRLETEPDLKNCRLDIVKLDNNKRVLYLDPESLDEFNALKKLNRIFGCYQN